MIKTQLSSAKYQALLDSIDKYFANSDIILQDDRNLIKLVEFKKEALVVKSFAIPWGFNRFIYTYFKKSKAKRAYEYALKIAEFTPKAIAYIENYQPLLKKSYFLCEKFEYDFNMQAPLFRNHMDKKNILKQFAAFVFELHQNQIIHQDLSPGNILIKKNEQGYEFKIIDINRMTFKMPTTKERAKNFSKLWADDDDLAIILAEYARLAELDKQYFINLGLKYNQEHKKRKTRKKKIKQVFGLC